MHPNFIPLVLLGTGPAGLAASVYASRYKIPHRLIGAQPGGLISQTHLVENWPGVISLSGPELATQLMAHAESYGVTAEQKTITSIVQGESALWRLTDSTGEIIETNAILYALGTQHNHLGIPGEQEFAGLGVSTCATCDGFFYRKKKVVVIGGGDSAAKAALYLADLADHVTLVHRREQFRCEPIWVEKLQARSNVTLATGQAPASIDGDSSGVTGITLTHGSKIDCDGVFVEIGSTPLTELLQPLGVALDESKSIIVDRKQRTNLTGIWAAGDVTNGSNGFRQAITAAAEGIVALSDIYDVYQAQSN